MNAFSHCAKCRSLIMDGPQTVGRHLTACPELEKAPEIVRELELEAQWHETNGMDGKAAKCLRTAALLSRLYAMFLNTEDQK